MAMAWTDRDALVALFRATGGERWVRKDNWDTDAELAEWYGVEANPEGRVVKIDLASNNLQGTPTVHGTDLSLRCVLDPPLVISWTKAAFSRVRRFSANKVVSLELGHGRLQHAGFSASVFVPLTLGVTSTLPHPELWRPGRVCCETLTRWMPQSLVAILPVTTRGARTRVR